MPDWGWTLQYAPVYTQGMRRLLLDWLPVRTFVVRDTSMWPTLWPGDRVLLARWLAARLHDIVVVRDPEQHARYLVKRIAHIGSNGAAVLHADNPNVSRDSRHFGAVPPRLIVGRVIFRYLPAERRGWLVSRQ